MNKILEIFLKLIKSIVEKIMYNRKISALEEKESSIKESIKSIETKKDEVKKNISKARNDLKKHKDVKVKKSVDDTEKYVKDFIKRRRK